jgi:uncharacterized protein (TIGR00369 family)
MAEEGGRSIEEEIVERVASSPFHASMGIAVDAVRAGEVDLRLRARPEHANLHGTVHGGVLATLAETAAGLAVRAATGQPAGRHASVHLDVQYLAPATAGTLRATGRVVKLGRRLAFAEAEVRDDRGAAVARAQVTVALSPQREAQPEAQ